MKAYIRLGNTNHIGYDIIWHDGRKLAPDSGEFCNCEFRQWVIDNCKYDNNFKPSKGDEIFLAPGCDLPIDDIRANYKIKRVVDSGVCNVMSPDKVLENDTIYTNMFAVSPSTKEVVIMKYYCENADAKLRKYFQDRGINDYRIVDNPRYTLRRCDGIGLYIDMAEGKFKKPCVLSKNLEIEKVNKLTADMLYLLFRVGKTNVWRADDGVEKFLLQLKAVAQTDWQKYPKSVRTVFRILYSNARNAAWYVKAHKSLRNKQTEPFFNLKFSEDVNVEEDNAMRRDLMRKITGIEGTSYVSYNDFLERLRKVDVPIIVALDCYDTMIRIKEK